MKKIRVAFDVDGTLRCNCTETCNDANQRIVSLAYLFSHFKNIELHCWSGGGADYAWAFVRSHNLAPIIKQSHCYSKLSAPHMDIAIDDQQEFSLADINLIVREK
jgi:hypothetical protein